jgi:acyl carrier protein
MDALATDKLERIFRAVFELPENANVVNLRQVNAPNWDSLAHVSLVAAIESEFDTTIDAADALRITSFQAALLVLEERGL